VQVQDIDRAAWMWSVRRQTTPGPCGLIDKGTKGKRARMVPIVEELREIVGRRLDVARVPTSRLFTGPRGGRISTAVLRDATKWDDVVTALGYERLRRHDLRHTGLTWMADAGVPVHVLQKIAGHGKSPQPSDTCIQIAGRYETPGHCSAPISRRDGPQVVPNGGLSRSLEAITGTLSRMPLTWLYVPVSAALRPVGTTGFEPATPLTPAIEGQTLSTQPFTQVAAKRITAGQSVAIRMRWSLLDPVWSSADT
jgi:Phage integrase family